MKKNILICAPAHEALTTGLRKHGFEVNYEPTISKERLLDQIAQYHGVIINTQNPIGKAQMEQGANLEFVGRLGSGLDIIDLEEAKARGISVLSTPEGNCDAVGEHALALLLAYCNHLPRAISEVKQLKWNREANRGREISCLTIGVIGFGHTGSAFAKKLAGLGCKVLAHDKYLATWPADLSWVKESTVSEIQQRCDVISIHLPLTAETVHFVDYQWLLKCEKRPIIINTARGKNIVTADLLRALENNLISAALLDVLDNEKINTWDEVEQEVYGRLFAHKEVMITPHVAGWTIESYRKISEYMLAKILNLYV